jgi:hypothetical protein
LGGLPRLRHSAVSPRAEESQAQRPGQAQWRRRVRGSPPATAIRLACTPKKAEPSAAKKGGPGVINQRRWVKHWVSLEPRRSPEMPLKHADITSPIKRLSPDYDNPTRTHAKESQAERSGQAERSEEVEFGCLPQLRHNTARPRAEKEI